MLHVVTYMGRGGLETLLMNYYRAIDRSQIQFDFLTHRRWESDYDHEIQEMGGKVFYLGHLNPFSPLYYKELRQFFDEHSEYTVIHVHQDCLSSVVLKVAKDKCIPIRIAHSHSSSQDKNIKYPIKLFFRCLIPYYATDLMACGEKAGEWMFRGKPFGILRNAIQAIDYAFDQERRRNVRCFLGIGDNTLLIGHVGRFHPAKNHEQLLDIFNEIHKQTISKLFLVGDGELRQRIEEKASRLMLQDDVVFAGI